MEKLIVDYEIELTEPGCFPGSGFYGLLVTLPADISDVFPYLNAVLEDTLYDRENRILIGRDKDRRYAFRANDIRVAGIDDVADAPRIAEEVVKRTNQVWEQREEITPSYRERSVPAAIDIYQLLPRTNCKECGYATCLAFAADARNDPELLEKCPPLSRPENADSRVQIERLFTGE
jgi:ArsR family metal-binding transcriptional regulator